MSLSLGGHSRHGLVEFAERFFLRFCHPLRHLHHQGHIVVAPDGLVPNGWNALSSQAHLRVGLCSRLHVVLHFSVHRPDADGAAQSSLRKGDRHSGEYVHILTLEDGVSGHHHFHQQIAPLSAAGSGLALPGQTDALAIVDACRDRHFEFLSRGNISGAVALRTFFADHLAGAAAVRTGLDILNRAEEGLLGVHDLAFAVAFRASLRSRAWLRACSMTVAALLLIIDLYLFFTSEDRLFKCDPYGSSYAGAAHRPVGSCAAPSSAAEDISENVPENIAHIGS